MTYGFSASDQFSALPAISAVSLRAKAGNLPVQAPSLFELGINLKTAKAIGIPSAVSPHCRGRDNR
jgi:hypothetical protein